MPTLTARVLITLAVLSAAAQDSVAQTGPRIFVLDQDARTVHAIDVESGRSSQSAAIEGTPGWLRRTPDGQRLIVLDRGQGRDAGDDGFRAKSRSVATILDAGTLAVQGQVDLGWGLEPMVMFDAAGSRMSVICSGFVSRNPKEALPRELVTVDLTERRAIGRVALPRRAHAFFSTPDGARAVVLSHRERGSAPAPAELRLIDLATPAELAVIPLEGDPRSPVLSPDGKYVYVLDRGDPSGNPDRNVNGRVHVISVSAATLDTTADAGSRPRGFVLDDRGQQMFVLSDAAPERGAKGDRPGQLRVLRGGAVSAPVPVPSNPSSLLAAADGTALVLVSGSVVTRLAMPDLKPISTLQAGVSGVPVAISPDGRRLFANHMQNLWTYDLERGIELEKITTGRMGARIFAALDATIATEASKSTGRREAQEKGRNYYFYTEYSVRDPDERMAVRPDGAAVYVLNQQTSDVTIVDSSNGKVLEKIGVDGFGVYFLPGASIAMVPDRGAIRAIDLTSHKKLDDLVPAASASNCLFSSASVSPDGRFALVRGSGCVATIGVDAGKPAATVHRFKRVADVEWDWSAPR